MRAPVRLARADLPAFVADRHGELWAQVPLAWQRWSYPLLEPPFHGTFSNPHGTTVLAFEVDSLPESLRQELAWWVWHCHDTGTRRINSTWLRNVVLALTELQRQTPQVPIDSVLLVTRRQLQHAYQEQFYARRGHLPAAAVTRNTDREATALQEALALRHDRASWWQLDTWDLRDDPRIPVRQHEPQAGKRLRFASFTTPWLRLATKYYFRVMLETGQHSWGSLLSRIVHQKYFDQFLLQRQLSEPALVDDPSTQLHALMLDYLSALRSRTVTTGPNKGGHLSQRSLVTAQLSIAAFYLFMVEHRHELVASTGDRRFLALGEFHARLWRTTDIPFGTGRAFGGSDSGQYIADVDLSQMTQHIHVLGLPCDQTTTIVRDGEKVEVYGLGDPSAMRAWLIQALTGRRASEILMTDFNPLRPVPGLPQDAAATSPPDGSDSPSDGEQFVAKYHYQQTKIRQAPDTILVGRDVASLIHEQQAWTRRRLHLQPSDPDPRYLFPALSENHKGRRARSAASYATALVELTDTLKLKDEHGRLIEFSKSHRLRHTKATNLLNLGAPIHVVVRYMGHRSPEMTMHYAATLAQTAEREFLRTQRVGNDGRELGLSAQDLYDMTALSARTDRVLPTGLCLLPPAKRCDKGNACYSCDFFATDASYLVEHQQLLADTRALITRRRQQVLDRTGREMDPDNIWLTEQLATIRALELVITALQQHPPEQTVRGSGVRGRAAYQSGPVPVQLVTHRQETYG